MADHYLKSVELLQEVDDLNTQLQAAYAAGHRPDRVAALHQSISRCLKLADIHATLAVRQELQEVATGAQLLGVRL